MSESLFDQAPLWAERLGQVRDIVRQRLVTSQLFAHLPEPTRGQIVVDVGCGQGTQVLALAERGHQVIGIDPSTELLDRARDALSERSSDLRSRVMLREGDLESLGEVSPDQIDILLCHGVLMYLPSLSDSLGTLARHLSRGGILSVLTRNQAGIAMRAGMEERWGDVVGGFDARHYTNNLGIEAVRADSPSEVMAECEAQSLEVLAWYGVRLFTDHWKNREIPDEIEALVDAEKAAGERDPYRGLAALTHVVATRPG